MSDKMNENALENEEALEEEVRANAAELTEDAETTAEEQAYDAANPKLEENDNWEFEAEAMTLKNTVIEGDELEIEIPEKPSYETRERPKATKPAEVKSEQKVKVDNKNATKFILTAIIAVLVIGVLTFFGIRYYTVPNNMEKMNPGNVAMTVGDVDISLGMYNYYYNSTVNTYKSQAQYGTVDIDIYTDFNEQETTDDDGNTITWAERFHKDTESQIKQLAVYYQEALENGETLTEAQEEQIQSTLDSLKSAAEESGMSVDAYIETNYGDYCGYNTLEKMIRMSYTAQNYLMKKTVEMKPDEERVQKYFEEHRDDYLSTDIAYLIMQYDEDTKDEVMASAEEYAASITTLDELKAAIPEVCAELIQNYVDMGYYSSPEACVEEIANEVELTVSSQTGFPEEAYNWVMSDEAKIGDCEAFAYDDGMLALIVLKLSDSYIPEEKVYTVRHILIQPETDTETVTNEETGEETEQSLPATDEQKAAAKAKAEEVYNEYLSGEQTETRFAELAEEYSQDPGSTLEQSGVYGGIYENISENQDFAEEFKAWSLDPSRKYGDTEIVETQFGYHIMFFVDAGPSYLADCKNAVLLEMEDEFVDSYDVKLHKSVIAKVKPADPEVNSATE